MKKPMVADRFKQFVSNGGEWIADKRCIHVKTPHLLTQIAGYSKFVSGGENQTIFFRGQSKVYEKMLANIYRAPRVGGLPKPDYLHGLINKYLADLEGSGAMIAPTPRRAYEPLMQHYGMSTRWLDAVDNIWVALWFACFEAKYKGKLNRFINYERRSLANADDDFAYIIVMQFDQLQPIVDEPGFFGNDGYEVVDLRVATPSLYLRPHAQHGVLFKKKRVVTPADADAAGAVFGTIRVSLLDALSWLGSGDLLTAHTIFPPAFYDQGYLRLLENAPAGGKWIGTITSVGT